MITLERGNSSKIPPKKSTKFCCVFWCTREMLFRKHPLSTVARFGWRVLPAPNRVSKVSATTFGVRFHKNKHSAEYFRPQRGEFACCAPNSGVVTQALQAAFCMCVRVYTKCVCRSFVSKLGSRVEICGWRPKSCWRTGAHHKHTLGGKIVSRRWNLKTHRPAFWKCKWSAEIYTKRRHFNRFCLFLRGFIQNLRQDLNHCVNYLKKKFFSQKYENLFFT